MVVDFLVHKEGDDVGIAVRDISANEKIKGKTLEGEKFYELETREDIPLGHKIALRDIKEGEKIKEYGEVIGKATKNITKGSHVHVHNIRSLRWG
ncbi:UxaA family hydrolase [Thermotoga sp. KOL6]|uniref:UxaA family hydrolase n=1 Tax=Thermotoga sp. KOL6 TaxID=126741 RepID=UPI000C778701|nr:UxaA family hydrolase [Thermotoga sp. KOL6]PLV59161.1 dehydratase [Thermotoga sp. KOL6]